METVMIRIGSRETGKTIEPRHIKLMCLLLIGILTIGESALAATWRSVFPLFGGAVYQIAIDKAGTAYVNTSGGLFKSQDNGAHWTSASGNLPAAENVQAITADPGTANVIYIGTDKALLRTTNGGTTWTDLGLPGLTSVSQIAIAPSNVNYIYVATSGSYVYRSTDGGATWIQSSTGLSGGWNGPAYTTTIAVDPVNPRRAYTATWRGQVFRTENGGDSWTVMDGGKNYWISQIVVAPSGNGVLWAVNDSVYTPYDNILESTDYGSSWFNAGRPAGSQDYGYVAVDPGNASVAYAATVRGLFKTTGSGVWSLVFSPPSGPIDLSAVAINRALPSYVFVASSFSGVYRSLNGGAAWQQSNSGIAAAVISDIAVSRQNRSVVYAGAQTVGLVKSTKSGSTWTAIGPAGFQASSTAAVAASPITADEALIGVGGSLWRTVDGGASFTAVADYVPGAIKYNPLNPTMVSASIQDWQGAFLFSSNGGSTWSVPQSVYIYPQNYVFHPSVPSIVFTVANEYTGAAVNTAYLMWSNSSGNGGWTKTPAVGKGHLSDIALDPSDPATLYAVGTLSSEGTQGVYKFHVSYNGSAVSEITRVPGVFSTGLGPATARRILYDGFTKSLFVTSNNGVFQSVDGGNSWSSISGGLTYLSTDAIAVTQAADTAYLLVGTNGGIWRYDLNPKFDK